LSGIATGNAPALRMLALGDSIIAGVGVAESREALPCQLAGALAELTDREVHWQARGRNGARTSHLLHLLESLRREEPPPDILVISNGINDVTTFQRLHEVMARKEVLLDALRDAFGGALIFQLGLPPLGAFPALPQPLRRILGMRAAALDAALAKATQKRPQTYHLPFDTLPEPEQFAADGYHPGAEAVALWAAELARQIAPRLH
jgi:lysophospholipase L1-like esterase